MAVPEQNDEFNQTFDVALHLGTLVAVVAYFWEQDIVRLLGAWLRSLSRRRVESADERIAWFVLVATIPAAIVGALAEDAIANNLKGIPGRSRSSSPSSASSSGSPTAARGTDDAGPRARARRSDRRRAVPRVHARGVEVRDHDHGRALPPARPRLRERFSFFCSSQQRSGQSSGRAQNNMLLGELPAGWEAPFMSRTIAAFGGRPSRDRLAARLLAPAQLHAVRDLPTRRGARDLAPERDRRPRGDVLTGRAVGRGTAVADADHLSSLSLLTVACHISGQPAFEPRRLLGALRRVASAVRIRAGAGQVAAGDNQVLLARIGRPSNQHSRMLAHPGRVAGLG